MSDRLKALLVSLSPPVNDCGIRVLMYRHLIQRRPYDLSVVTNDAALARNHGFLETPLPKWVRRIRNSRFHRWGLDIENFLSAWLSRSVIDREVSRFQPDVVLSVADNSLCHAAHSAARKWRLPLAGFFQDWFPIMDGYFGHSRTSPMLEARFRSFYRRCDLALCISEGMRQQLGPHRNSHVLYPISGQEPVSVSRSPAPGRKFRLVYVGSVERFYGRMVSALVEATMPLEDMEFIVVGPRADWAPDLLERARQHGSYLGFKPTEEAAALLRSADALLVAMSFESEFRLFMETSFNTKIADYCALTRPIVFWGPAYAAPVSLLKQAGSAAFVDNPDPRAVVETCRRLAADPKLREDLVNGATALRRNHLDPEKLQQTLVEQVERIVTAARSSKKASV